jgi:hypothetical protein
MFDIPLIVALRPSPSCDKEEDRAEAHRTRRRWVIGAPFTRHAAWSFA